MKYARAAWWIALSWLARKLRLPFAEDWSDNASLAMFTCSLDFEPVTVVGRDVPEHVRREIAYAHRGEVVPDSGVAIAPKSFGPVRYSCPHLSIGGDLVGPPSTWCGCEMQPIYKTA